MVYHEFKTPLTGIRAAAQLMQRRAAYSAWATQAIITETDRLTRLITDLLDTLCLEDGSTELRHEWVDLVALAEAGAAWAQQLSQQHTVQVETPGRPLVCWADPRALEAILHNLLANAIQYAPGGGTVVVQVEDRGQEAYVGVTDQGRGILQEELPRVFDRFYRVADPALYGRQGLGLGLYCCTLLIERQGGRLWAESTPGQGSTFFFTLPTTQPDHRDEGEAI